MTQSIDLDAIAKRHQAATGGCMPWSVQEAKIRQGFRLVTQWRVVCDYIFDGPQVDVCVIAHHPDAQDRRAANAEFIAHAREDVPALLRIAEKAKALVEAMGQEVMFSIEVDAALAELDRALGDET
jgi:hypothetical protein